MTEIERLHATALEHLAAAQRSMFSVMSISDDWTAKVALKIDFEELEKSVRDFGRFQLAIRQK